ncbi:MAG: GerMN domain-containing protein [Actinomycetota bacterium]|nr:GerMN domain-containing protein [Actinomycetota bacterium]
MNTEDRLKKLTEAARAESAPTQAEWSSFIQRAHRALYVRRAVAAAGTFMLIGVGALGTNALMSDQPLNDRRPQPATTPEPSPSRAPGISTDVGVPASEAELWFVKGEQLWWGTTTLGGRVSANLASDDPIVQKAVFWLQALFEGPTSADQEVGAISAVPSGTKLLGVRRAGSVLNVDVSSEFESGGGSLSIQLRVAQVIYTGTQFEGIDAVRILIEGEKVEAIGGEGLIVAEPLIRRDFQNVAPLIVVESVKTTQDFVSPVTVTGFASVFEATVNIRILDAEGKVLKETFTTASCGTGCWGDFSETLAFEVPERQQGRVEVLTYSPKDGSEQDLVSIPVVLSP